MPYPTASASMSSTDGLKAKKTQINKLIAKMERHVRVSMRFHPCICIAKNGKSAMKTMTPMRPEFIAAIDTGEIA